MSAVTHDIARRVAGHLEPGDVINLGIGLPTLVADYVPEGVAMIRGGHVSVVVLGVLQVDRLGRIANWAIPGKPILGVGGAMDLLVGAQTVIVATTHLTRKGDPKIVEECSFPLTGARPADLIVTEHATFSVDEEGLVLEEIAPDSTFEWVRSNTPAPFRNSTTLEAI